VTDAEPDRGAAVVDVGGGTATLADELLALGYDDVSVLDASEVALGAVARRVIGRGRAPTLIHADVLRWEPPRCYRVWHDRAVFHFLVTRDERARYAAVATRAVTPGGVLVIGTFAADGPTHCSGLPVVGRQPDELAAAFPSFELEHAERSVHVTPQGVVQPFTWITARAPDP
jgi:hypothetical protein